MYKKLTGAALALLALASFPSVASFTPKQWFMPEINAETDEAYGTRLVAGDGFVIFHSPTTDDLGGLVRVFAPDSRGHWRQVEVLREGSGLFGSRVAVDGNRIFITDMSANPGDSVSPFASGIVYEYAYDSTQQEVSFVQEIERPKLGISSFAKRVAYSNGWLGVGTSLDQNGSAGGLEGGKVFLFQEAIDGTWEFHSEIEPFDADMIETRVNGFSDRISISYPWMAVYSSVGYNSLSEEGWGGSIYLYHYDEELDEWVINHKIETIGLSNPAEGFRGISELALAQNELIFAGSADNDVRYLSHFQYDESTDQWSMIGQLDYGEIDGNIDDELNRLRHLANFAEHIELVDNTLYVGSSVGRRDIIDGIQYSFGQIRIYERASFSSPWEEVERIEPPMLTEHEYPPNPRRTNSFGDEFSLTTQGELVGYVGGRVYGERVNGNVLLLTTENNEKSLQIEHAVADSTGTPV